MQKELIFPFCLFQLFFKARFKHDDRKRNRKNIADKSKEQLAHELADSKRKLRELKKAQSVPKTVEVTLHLGV